jgi:hypothetical protein
VQVALKIKKIKLKCHLKQVALLLVKKIPLKEEGNPREIRMSLGSNLRMRMLHHKHRLSNKFNNKILLLFHLEDHLNNYSKLKLTKASHKFHRKHN